MAYTFESNGGVVVATGSVVIYLLKTLLKSVGWTVPSSSDGTTYNSSGDQITTSASGAGGMANNNAWFRIKEPGANGREYLFQRGTTNPAWRILYSGPSNGFTGGSPSATQTPSAADEQGIAGGGTHASPTFTTWFGTDGTYKVRMAAGGATELYTWYMWTHNTASFAPISALAMEKFVAGTYNALDEDPSATLFELTGAFGSVMHTGGSATSGSAGFKAWFKKALVGAAYTVYGWCNYTFAGTVYGPGGTSGSGGINPYSGKDDVLPLFFARAGSGNVGRKGIAYMFKAAAFLRAQGDTYTVVTTKDYLCVSSGTAECHLVPWDGTDFVP